MDSKYLKFRHPFTAYVPGATGSGKTYWVRKVLLNWKNLIHGIQGPVLDIVWCYGVWQELYNQSVAQTVKVTYVKGLIDEEYIREGRPHVIVIDDLMSDLAGNRDMSQLFTRGSHHLNVSVFFIVQNLFHKGPEMRTINLNSQYIILMMTVRDVSQIEVLGRQLFGRKWHEFMSAYKSATEQPYGYLVIDLKPDTPKEYRLRTRIFPDELKGNISNLAFAPIIYRIKD